MSEKCVVVIGMSLLWLLLPYGITMILTGSAVGKDQIMPSGITVEYEQEGQVHKVDLEEYMIGVLAAEVPADYQFEMYKAQAVIIRTNARKLAGDSQKLLAQDLNMGYLSQEELKNSLGTQRYKEYYEKLKNAIMKTQGETLKYNGQYIDALYHSVSIGKTASAKDVYGKDIPYLESVSSSVDVEAKDYMQMETYNYAQLLEKLGVDEAAAQANYGINPQNFQAQLAVSEKSEDGYAKKVQIGTRTLSGEDFKNQFGLNSLYFYMENKDDGIRIICLGKGHGLGLSQFGANKMAQQGKNYKKILKHYYKGAEIVK